MRLVADAQAQAPAKQGSTEEPPQTRPLKSTKEDVAEPARADSQTSGLEAKLPDEGVLHEMIGKQADVEDGEALGLAQGNEMLSMLAGAGDDQDLRQGDNKADETIKMLCEAHKAPAVFFSQQQDRYLCFKCLVISGQLLYIDQSYKQEMEDFERIRDLTAGAVTANITNTTIIKQWKAEIRACLMRLRVEFNRNIDNFIELFSEKFKDVEMSTDLLEFRGEDKKLQHVVEDL